MAQISLNIKDNLLAKEIGAVAAMNGWTETVQDPSFPEDPTKTIPNPVTKEQFFKKQIKAWARNQAVEYANRQALEAVTMVADEA